MHGFKHFMEEPHPLPTTRHLTTKQQRIGQALLQTAQVVAQELVFWWSTRKKAKRVK